MGEDHIILQNDNTFAAFEDKGSKWYFIVDTCVLTREFIAAVELIDRESVRYQIYKEPTVPYGALDAAAHPLAQFVTVLGPVGVFVAFKKPNTI